MQYQEVSPPYELRDTIKCVWYTSLNFGQEQSNFEVVPDGYAEIVFLFGSACSFIANGALQPLPSPFLMGLLNQPVILRAIGRLEVIGIRCFPWAVFDLLGLSSSQDSVRVFEHPIARLQPTLADLIQADRVDEALNQVSQYFRNAQSRVSVDTMLLKAGTAMRQANGTMPVNQVATAAHATVRTLERKFKQAAGRTVKDVSGLIRFEQVRNQLWLHPDISLAGLAHELGYTDQAHLSREFRRYSGTTPAAFARKARRGKQVLNTDFVAFIQA
jgi:AraC-like DNA-binding protein